MKIKVNDYANKTRTDDVNNDELVHILLNCIITGKNVAFDKQTNKKEWVKVNLLIHPDLINMTLFQQFS